MEKEVPPSTSKISKYVELFDSYSYYQRGITIMSKTTRVDWEGMVLNIVDTPGHSDFGGEVGVLSLRFVKILFIVKTIFFFFTG